ncbi:isochorismatase family protein [Maribellus sp. YY47]|uniref:isochorismatase family protein n=1 Tax=Maribellus sp. YY47 TaxID=2929486 RepID=UPI0020014D8D|nr:isochorismatase family protein [Maribellus sp. YY47]MCK3682735.1 isochorismatase family protein [Maribellus sp. YY47]
MRITKEDTIGLIIDIQERLLPAMHDKDTLLKNCKILVEGLKQLSIPLMVSQQYTKGLGETLTEISSLVPEFEYFEKKDFSCFDVPEIREKLISLNAKKIIICGIESHVCVLQTAVDLKEAGLNPIVVMDCVSSRSPENLELAKERFRHEGIMMTSYESILFELTRAAGSDEFKAISKLVK